MAYTNKFQQLADTAMAQVQGVSPGQVDELVAQGAVALDIRDKEEHDADHLAGSVHVSRGKLEMNIEGVLPDLNITILCYCNANNRGALSANTLRQMGYVNARYIAGGLKAYKAQNLLLTVRSLVNVNKHCFHICFHTPTDHV
jgi:rhodanese-related sulfurtransferase